MRRWWWCWWCAKRQPKCNNNSVILLTVKHNKKQINNMKIGVSSCQQHTSVCFSLNLHPSRHRESHFDVYNSMRFTLLIKVQRRRRKIHKAYTLVLLHAPHAHTINIFEKHKVCCVRVCDDWVLVSLMYSALAWLFSFTHRNIMHARVHDAFFVTHDFFNRLLLACVFLSLHVVLLSLPYRYHIRYLND